MKVTKQIQKATKDGSDFDITFEVRGLTYLKIASTDKRALYSIFDKKTEKLHGFAVKSLTGSTTKHKSLSTVNLKQFQNA
jgi:hypothetical protein